MQRSRRATVADIDAIARRLPGVEVNADGGLPGYQVRGKSFVFFRTPRKDAVDAHGERLTDVIVFWVESEGVKQLLVDDPGTPFFSTPHFDGHPSVLLQGSRVGELSLAELTEIVTDAWLARAPVRMASEWLAHAPQQNTQP